MARARSAAMCLAVTCTYAGLLAGNVAHRRTSLAPSHQKSAGAAEESQIRAVLDAQAAAWNRGDVDRFMTAYWKSDQTLFVGANGVARGYEAVLARYHKAYPKQRAMGHLTFSNMEVQVECADTVTVIGQYHLQRENDNPAGVFTLNMRKFPEGWRIVRVEFCWSTAIGAGPWGVTSIIVVQMDHHTLAEISITGSCLDVIGSLYLAYDLLGGPHGPLRVLTRAVTYAIVFGVGYAIGLGPFFGVAAGIATGITLSVELNRAARGLDHYSLPWEGVFSAIRGFGFSVGLYRIVGLEFALVFGLLVTAGQVVAYSRGMRPAMDYVSARRPRFTRRQFRGTIVRTIGYTAAALISSALVHRMEHAWLFAIRVGLVTGFVTGLGSTVNPYIEYYADNLPERRLGAFGIGLIFGGFLLQSLQYWLALFDVRLS